MNVNWNSPDFEGFAGQNPFQRSQSGPRPVRKPIGTPLTRTVINLLVTLLFAAVYFYVTLPALNFKSGDLYVFLFLICAVYCGCAVITSGFQGDGVKGYFGFVKKQCKIPALVAAALIVTSVVGTVTGWEVIRASAYRDLLTVTDGDFAAEVEEISFDQIPMLDRDSAERLGNRKLGELADMVSQFEVAADYTQINYQGSPVRVTPLRYGDLIKWLNNRAEGLPAYLIIDMVTQDVDVVRLEEGIRYTTAEHFGRNLWRHLRFQYPTYMFDTPAFEIDETGHPFWVCPRIDKTIGLFGGTDITGAVLVDAVTGESTYYDVADVPEWVDHVYTAELIIQQYDYHGAYINGFLNSIFGQRGMTQTTDGYNYIAIGDDVYMYTGITSVVSDESNIGFILSNQRTKETRFYQIAGAEEYSAMASARGQVQHLGYTATFPLLLNISEQPTYFMALKDAAGLVKMYAMVNVNQYQIVATGATVGECEGNYRQMLANNGLIGEEDAVTKPEDMELFAVEGLVQEIRSAVIDGNTHYYLLLDSHGSWFSGKAGDLPQLILLNAGDYVELQIIPSGGGVAQPIYSVEVGSAPAA